MEGECDDFFHTGVFYISMTRHASIVIQLQPHAVMDLIVRQRDVVLRA